MHFIGLVGRKVKLRSSWDSGLGKEGEGRIYYLGDILNAYGGGIK